MDISWSATDPISVIKMINKNVNGTRIPILILSINNNDDRSPPIANAPLSPINILAGLILYRKKATKTARRIAMTVVAIYVP